MSVQQTYNLARQAGFPPDTARQMVAIAQRESALRPDVACINCVPGFNEASVGLWQINTRDPAVWSRVKAATGATSPEDLKDPVLNARAAYALYDGNPRNIQIAWATDRDGAVPWRTRFLNFLGLLPSTDSLENGFADLDKSAKPTFTSTVSDGFADPARSFLSDLGFGNEEGSSDEEPWKRYALIAGVAVAASMLLNRDV